MWAAMAELREHVVARGLKIENQRLRKARSNDQRTETLDWNCNYLFVWLIIASYLKIYRIFCIERPFCIELAGPCLARPRSKRRGRLGIDCDIDLSTNQTLIFQKKE